MVESAIFGSDRLLQLPSNQYFETLFRIFLSKLVIDLFGVYFCIIKPDQLENLLTSVLPLSLTHSGNSFTLAVGEEVIQQSTCEFMLTFSTMVGTDIEAYLADLSNECDEVRVPLSGIG